jgi:hypothetical protein
MIINNFDSFRSAFGPVETNAVLIVYSNAKLSFTITRQAFQAISWGYAEFIKKSNRIKLIKLSSGNFPQGWGTGPSRRFGIYSVEDILRSSAAEGLDHDSMITRLACYCKIQY